MNKVNKTHNNTQRIETHNYFFQRVNSALAPASQLEGIDKLNQNDLVYQTLIFEFFLPYPSNKQHKEKNQVTLIKNQISDNSIENQFNILAEQWYLETLHSSGYLDKVLHPAYQRIIGLGKDAIPFILRELQDAPTDWFWALRALTGEDPTTRAQSGKKDEMAKMWLNWGKENNYI